jgi:hypothetical protein
VGVKLLCRCTGNIGWVPHSSRFWLEWDTTALDLP